MNRRLTLLLPALALAALLAGCFSFIKEDSAAQQDVIGPVRVTTTVCPYDLGQVGGVRGRGATARAAVQRLHEDDGANCLDHDEAYDQLEQLFPYSLIPRQVMVAYRVPEGTTAPETLTADVNVLRFEDVFNERSVRVAGGRVTAQRQHGEGAPEPVAQRVTFRRSASLESELPGFYEMLQGDATDKVALLGGGQKVVGYISDVVPGAIIDEFALHADFPLPAGPAEGQPYAGPFEHLSMVGNRWAWDDLYLPVRAGEDDPYDPFDPDRPVDCENIIEEDLTLCPLPHMGLEGNVADALGSTSTPTRDLRVVAQGDPVVVEQGGTATVPFTLRAAGEPSEEDFDLGADVSIQDGKATPRDATWKFPGTGEYEQPVTVQVPHYTEPGEYVVRLVADEAIQDRDSAAKIIVKAKPGAVQERAPQKLPPAPDNLYLRGGGVPFGYICVASPKDCADSSAELWVAPSAFGTRAVAAQAGQAELVRAGSVKFRAKKGKRVVAKIRLGRKAKRALKRGRTLRGLLVVRSGGKAVQTRGAVVRAKR
jgi:hypothetical protein